MQHRMDDIKLDEWERLRGKIMERPEVSEEVNKRAEYHCFRNKDEQCYIPADHIKGALINAGSYLKAKVGGRSLEHSCPNMHCEICNPKQDKS